MPDFDIQTVMPGVLGPADFLLVIRYFCVLCKKYEKNEGKVKTHSYCITEFSHGGETMEGRTGQRYCFIYHPLKATGTRKWSHLYTELIPLICSIRP